MLYASRITFKLYLMPEIFVVLSLMSFLSLVWMENKSQLFVIDLQEVVVGFESVFDVKYFIVVKFLVIFELEVFDFFNGVLVDFEELFFFNFDLMA